MSMFNKMVSMIKIALSTDPMIDTKKFPFLKAKFMTKVNDIWFVTPYGFYSSPPEGSIGLVFNIQAQEQNRAGIFNDYDRRPKDLKEGEVALFNTLTKTRITLKANGDLDIFVKNDRIINITGDDTINISGARNVTIQGNETVTVNGGLLTCNVDEFRINGELRVRDDIKWDFGSTEESLNNFQSIYNTHTHDENDNAPAPTDGPNQTL